MAKRPCVYILGSQRFGTIHVGLPSNLIGPRALIESGSWIDPAPSPGLEPLPDRLSRHGC